MGCSDVAASVGSRTDGAGHGERQHDGTDQQPKELGTVTETAKLNRRQDLRVRGREGHGRPRRHRHQHALYATPAASPTIPASPRRQPANPRSPSSTATKASCSIAAIPIDQLAEHGDFLEVCYLLLYGELPTTAQKDDFDHRVTHHTMVHEQMTRFFTGFRRDAHPMAVMCGVVGALSAFYHDSTDISDPLSAHGRARSA